MEPEESLERPELLKALLASPCPHGASNAICPVAEWRRVGHVGHMTRSLISSIMRKHKEHEHAIAPQEKDPQIL